MSRRNDRGWRTGTTDDQARAFAEVAAAPHSKEARAHLVLALQSPRALTAARAARAIREHRIEGLDAELGAAFARFLENPVKTDPGCTAKLAALEALDYGESMDEGPFLRGVRTFQLEGAWGPPEDTAAGVRARAIVALARLGVGDFELLCAERLCDPTPPVRQAAAEALAHRGVRSGAALALLKLRTGDEDPMVLLSCMSTLLALAPDVGLEEVCRDLDGPNKERREVAALALGESRLDDALTALLGAYARCIRPTERALLLQAVALHRSDRALDALLRTIATARPADARAAIAALAPRKHEPGLAGRVRQAAAENAQEDVGALVRTTFSDDDEVDGP